MDADLCAKVAESPLSQAAAHDSSPPPLHLASPCYRTPPQTTPSQQQLAAASATHAVWLLKGAEKDINT